MSLQTATTILIVDDAAENLSVLSGLLRPQYRVLAATSGEDCLRIASSQPQPDLILLDVMMPGMDGYAVLARLLADPATRDIPVVFITALAGMNDEEHGLRLGAADYISKPIQPTVVLARVRTQLDAKKARDWMKDQNAALEAEVKRRMAENDLTQQVGIRALAHLAELRDTDTGNHILRTQGHVRQLATRLSEHPRFRAILSPTYIDLLARSAPLHDIGKVGIPDTVLNKPGPHTDAEASIMRTHAEIGARLLGNSQRPVMKLAAEIALTHHENWDGSGYPSGLAGEAIPRSGRITMVADVFDALGSRRCYKESWPAAEIRSFLEQQRGRKFDPLILDKLLGIWEEALALRQRLPD